MGTNILYSDSSLNEDFDNYIRSKNDNIENAVRFNLEAVPGHV